MNSIYFIVEGHGEVQAIPVLARLILHRASRYDWQVFPPYRLNRSKIVEFDDELHSKIQYGVFKLQECVRHDERGGVAILIDADDDCPSLLNTRFMDFYSTRNYEFPVVFVAANREYESWFISCGDVFPQSQDFREHRNIEARAEEIRDAKGYFEQNYLRPDRIYSTTVDQPKFSAVLNIEVLLERSRSFQKFYKEFFRIVL